MLQSATKFCEFPLTWTVFTHTSDGNFYCGALVTFGVISLVVNSLTSSNDKSKFHSVNYVVKRHL